MEVRLQTTCSVKQPSSGCNPLRTDSSLKHTTQVFKLGQMGRHKIIKRVVTRAQPHPWIQKSRVSQIRLALRQTSGTRGIVVDDAKLS